MNHSDLLVDAYGRIQEIVHSVLDDIAPDALTYRPDSDANSIAWLIWHLTRVQDDHVAGVAGSEQLWTSDGWLERFDLPFETTEIGYGQSPADVAAVTADADLLREYHDAVHARTVAYVSNLAADELDRIVDHNWTPAVTLGARLVSVVSDDLQHAGQASYVLGLYGRLQP